MTEPPDGRAPAHVYEDFDASEAEFQRLREQRTVEQVAVVLHRQDQAQAVDSLQHVRPRFLHGRLLKRLMAQNDMGTLAPARQEALRVRAREVIDTYRQEMLR